MRRLVPGIGAALDFLLAALPLGSDRMGAPVMNSPRPPRYRDDADVKNPGKSGRPGEIAEDRRP
jgi:hypothetical protein